MVREILVAVTMFSAPWAIAQTPGSTPPPGTPVISQPLNPGQCVVACVPGSSGGGVGGSFGGASGGLGGGSSGGFCKLYCAPMVIKGPGDK